MNKSKSSFTKSETLMGCLVVAQHFNKDVKELSTVRTVWTPEYSADLLTRVEGLMSTALGKQSNAEQKDATMQLVNLQGVVNRDVSFLKTQIEVDFGADAPLVLGKLAIPSQLNKVMAKQETIIQFLAQLEQGMTAELKQQIIEKGTNEALVDRIIAYGSQFKQYNLNQEVLKNDTKSISANTMADINEVFTEVMGICKIASRYYQFDPIKKERYTFSKIVSSMGNTKGKAEE
ncbi:hypothetical protein [Saccharicrinis aurantiacus]|uniref:hypothetical protein n=1 Tax=Saccharicrinis aurantiacus TaxID=1849719 RepID=UPI002490960C|nr:hypothetical protein [Saccharicrinis aurantiacus]